MPPVGPNDPRLGAINIGNTAGGVNWPGSGFDPETATFYTLASNTNVTVGEVRRGRVRAGPRRQADAERQVVRKPRWEADPNYGARGTNQPGGAPPPPPAACAAGRGRGAHRRRSRAGRRWAEGLDGLPIVKPPYGVIAGDRPEPDGKLIFQVPHGDTPDNVRNHPLLRGMNIPKTGQGASVGIMVTKTMVVAGDPQITTPPGRARGAMLRAYDKKTGAQLARS